MHGVHGVQVAQDRRIKNVGERQKAQVQVKRFLVALKLDCQVIFP